jgi:hypothetical protein
VTKHINQDLRNGMSKEPQVPIKIKTSNVLESEKQVEIKLPETKMPVSSPSSRLQKLEAMTKSFNISNLSYK